MKTFKLISLSILSFICFTSTDVFVSGSFSAYSQDQPPKKETREEKCYTQYPKEKYPEVESYCRGVGKTEKAQFNQIWRNLVAITKNNPNITWGDNELKDHLLVITWAKGDRYRDKVDKGFIYTERDIWVTVPPELKNFCKNFSKGGEVTLPYRINQLLGVPPEDKKNNEERRIVAIWVEESDLFRPTPDPEITDHEAEVDFPDLKNLFISIPQIYRKWFSDQSKTNEAPWTKLGYTYDWGQRSDWQKVNPNRKENVGLSEFIIRSHAKVKIHSVTTIDNYCQ